MGFSEQLKKARLNMNYTQQQVADLMGITKSAYCGYETGKRQPDIVKIKQLANILNISSDVLLETGFESQSVNQEENKKDANTSDTFDIKTHIDEIMESLEGKEKIAYEGKEVILSEQNKRLLRYAMEIAYEAAKNHRQ